MRFLLRMLLVVATISVSSVGALAEEGSHYFPGALSSFIDTLPVNTGSETIAVANESLYYHGSNNHLIPGGGSNATTYTNVWAFLYQLPGAISLLPGKPQYSVALVVPYTWLQVHRPFRNSKGVGVLAKDTDNGFGDVEMFPFMLGWSKIECEKKGERFKYQLDYQTQFGIYAPTGAFDNNNVANVGRNFWTFEPGAAASFLRYLYPGGKTKLALEFTTSAGFDFNTKNSASQYQTGDQFHLDGTLAVHKVVEQVGGLVGAGVSGFFYQQITRDSGVGAKLGSFEAMTTGVGPDLSFITRFEHVVVAAEVKWLPELSVTNRLQGNAVWFKLAFSWADLPKCPVPEGRFATLAAPAAPAAPLSAGERSLYSISSF
jgi:hypothetical protein